MAQKEVYSQQALSIIQIFEKSGAIAIGSSIAIQTNDFEIRVARVEHAWLCQKCQSITVKYRSQHTICVKLIRAELSF